MLKRHSKFRMMVQQFTMVVCVLLPTTSSFAASEPLQLDPGLAGFADLGAIQCDYFIELLPIGPKGFRQSLMTYAQGFVYAKSGKTIDQILAGQAQSWTYNSLSEEMVQYCRANPSKSIPDAAAHLWSALSS